jgi:hypothetical protein
MANPTPEALHAVNIPLTNVSIAYMQSDTNFIATKVFPILPVSNKSDTYYKYDRADWNRAESKLRAPATESAGGGWNLSTDTYLADVWAVHKDNSAQDYANADSVFNLDQEAAEWVTMQMLLRQDIQFVTKYFTTGIWTGDQTGVAAAPAANQFLQWNDTNSTPIQNIRAQVTAMTLRTGGLRPNTLILGPQVYQALLDNAQIISRVQYTQGGFLSEEILARAFGVDRILIPWGVQNTAVEGATEASAFLYGKSALLAYVPPRVGPRTASAGYTFAWTGYLGASALGTAVSRFDIVEKKATRIEGESAFDMKVVDPGAAVFFASAIA